MIKLSAPILATGLLAILFVGCSDDRSPTSPSEPSASLSAPALSSQLTTLGNAQSQVFDCSKLSDANVRFSSPGYIRGNAVRLFVMYEGLPGGAKKLQIWWDEENDPTHSDQVSLGEGDPTNESRTFFAIRDYVDHVYRGVTDVETRTVRVRLTIEGATDDCSRVRHIEIGPPVDGAGGCSGVQLSNPAWFVNAAAAAAGTGTRDSPFTTLAAASAAASPGDTIYVFSGTYAVSPRIRLSSGQSLIGSGVEACHNGRSLPVTSAPLITRPAGSGRVIQTDGDATVIGVSTSGGSHGIRVSGVGSVTLRDIGVTNFTGQGIRITAAANVSGTRLTINAPGGSWGSRQNVSGSTLSLRNSTVNVTQGHRMLAGTTLILNQVNLTMQSDRALRAVNGAVAVAGSGNTATSVSNLCTTNGTGSYTGSVQFVSVNGGAGQSCP